MKQILAAVVVIAASPAALAQPRPSTLAMSCGQASALVTSRGAIVLGTGGHTYDRFVRDNQFCLRSEFTDPVWVRAADTSQCFIGYRCKERDPQDP